MPGYDQTGPLGQGPMTGRGYGPCGFGFGWRKRFGVGRGMGRYFNWSWPSNELDQKKALLEYKKALEEELEDIKKELSETDDKNEKEKDQ